MHIAQVKVVNVRMCLLMLILTTEHMSIPDQRWTVYFTWSPGATSRPLLLGGSLRKDSPGWEKAENKFIATSGLPACVCVCVLCRLHICTCVFQCVVCAIKKKKPDLTLVVCKVI